MALLTGLLHWKRKIRKPDKDYCVTSDIATIIVCGAYPQVSKGRTFWGSVRYLAIATGTFLR
jgi:hypothetical protein